MQGFPTVRCNGECTKCPIKFHCYTTEGSEYLEVTLKKGLQLPERCMVIGVK